MKPLETGADILYTGGKGAPTRWVGLAGVVAARSATNEYTTSADGYAYRVNLVGGPDDLIVTRDMLATMDTEELPLFLGGWCKHSSEGVVCFRGLKSIPCDDCPHN